jgi:hypothetical protein
VLPLIETVPFETAAPLGLVTTELLSSTRALLTVAGPSDSSAPPEEKPFAS